MSERTINCNGEVDANQKQSRFGNNALSCFSFSSFFALANVPFGPGLVVIEEGAIDQQLQLPGKARLECVTLYVTSFPDKG